MKASKTDCLQVICADKTGTLTSNAMTVVAVAVPKDEAIEQFQVFGDPGSASGQIVSTGTGLSGLGLHTAIQRPADIEPLLFLSLCSAVCTDSNLAFDDDSGKPKHLGESTEVALQLFAEKIGVPSTENVQVAYPSLPWQHVWRCTPDSLYI